MNGTNKTMSGAGAKSASTDDGQCGRREGPDRRTIEQAVVQLDRRRGERRATEDRRITPRV